MGSKISSSGISFDSLGNTPGFMQLLMDSICNCVLLLNNEMELQAFNNAFKTIFSNKKEEDLLYKKCGDALGCAFSVEEIKECGTTSRCKYCDLREMALMSYIEKKSVYRKKLDREFFINEKKKELKHLQFSIKPFKFKQDYYLMVVIEDITRIVEQNNLIKLQQSQIKKLTALN